MARTEELISRLRDALTRDTGDGAPPHAEELANTYAQSVEAVNQKLSQCIALLRQGLRTEALHLAEIRPPLLEEAALLDFPLRESWLELCRKHHLVPPPLVDEAAVIEIDEHYLTEARLGPVLERHRKLALGRAPLRYRLRVLRRLAELDVDNPLWKSEIAELETVRKKEIPDEFRRAAKHEDREALNTLWEELNEPWHDPPAAAMVQELDRFRQQVRVANAQADLDQLQPQIARAHADQETETLRAHLSAYAAAAEDVQGHVTPADVNAAAAYLAECDRQAADDRAYAQALAELEQGLGENLTLARLTPRMQAAERFQRGVPDALAERYDQRVQAQRQADLVRLRRRNSLIAAGVIAVALVVGVVLFQNYRRAQADSAYDRAAAAYDAGNPAEARAALDTFAADHPGLSKAERFQTLSANVDSALQQERDRQTRYNEALAAVEQAGIWSPDMDNLALAESLARTDSEKQAVASQRASIEAAQAQSDQERNAVVQARLDELEPVFQGVVARQAYDQATLSTLRRMRREAQQMRDTPNLRPSLERRLDLLHERVTQTLAAAGQQAESAGVVRRAVNDLANLTAQPEAYTRRLRQALDEEAFTGDRLRQQFARALAAAERADDPIAWTAILGGRDTLHVSTLEEAQRFSSLLAQYRQQHPRGFYTNAAERYADYLARAANALDPDHLPTQAEGDLQLLLRSPLVDSLHVLTQADGNRYYTNSADEGQAALGDNRLYRIYSNRADTLNGQLFDKYISVEALAGNITPEPSPQMRFAAAASDRLADLSAGWELLHLDLLQILMQTPEMDAVHRAEIARDLISLSAEYDWVAYAELAELDAQLAVVRTDVDWMDPTSNEADRQRTRAQAVFDEHPIDFEALRAQHADFFQQLAQDAKPRFPLAVFMPTAAAEPSTRPNPSQLLIQADRLQGELQVLETQADGSVVFVTIARVQQGRPEWTEAAARTPVAGLVFWLPAPEGAD